MLAQQRELPLHLLTDLNGTVSAGEPSPRDSSSKCLHEVHRDFPICGVAEAWDRDFILNGLQIV